MPAFDDAQAAVLLRFCVDPSVYVPVAMNCSFKPFGIDGFAGVTAIDTSVAGPTVISVLADTAPEVALICELPCPAPVARPPEVMVPTLVFDDPQVTELVTSTIDPSV